MTEGDKTAAASLALADVMFEERESSIPDSLTVAEAAKRLRLAPNTVYDLCAQGEIIHHRVGRAIRLRPADIEEFRRRSTEESRPQLGRYGPFDL
ncbi:MAG: helix-turn-helix domain-containing protein [Thermoguttaceae bacterium]